MDEFLKVFGDITISTVAVVIVALVFLWKLYTIVKNHLIEKYKQEEEKEKKVQEVIEQASNYPKWHEQSVKIQKQFSETIAAIQTAQLNNLESLNRLAKMIAENEATTCRYRILRFNDEILHEQKHAKEHFDQISMMSLGTRSSAPNILSTRTTRLFWLSRTSRESIRTAPTKTLSCKED